MNRKFFLVILIGIAVGMQGSFAQETFTWQLALIKNEQGLPFDNTVAMRDGETFYINIFSERDCYAYVVAETSSGAMHIFASRQVRAGVPVRYGGFTLNAPAGQETFYVVTSLSEQSRLQTAIDNYNRNITASTTRVLTARLFEIRDPNLDDHGSPVDFAGSARSATGLPQVRGTEYSGAAAYIKVITISH